MFKIIGGLLGVLVLCTCGTSQRVVRNSPDNYSHWTVRQKSLTLKNRHQLHYIDEGKGPVIVLLHGVPTSGWLYRHMIPKLVSEGYRVIAPDMLGYGNSSKPKGYDIYNPTHQQAYLMELMDSIGINEWTHVCHDGGGLWTWEFLKNNPGHINKLVILNSIIFDEGFNPPMQMKKNGFTKAYTKLYTMGISRKSTIEGTLRNGLSRPKEVCTPVMTDGYLKPMKGKAHRALYQFFSNANTKMLPDYTSVLENAKMPAMVIWGAKDKILVWETQKEKVKAALTLKDENIHILPNATHFIQEEEPNQISNWIASFAK
jgi:haloalkane dehalogenase